MIQGLLYETYLMFIEMAPYLLLGVIFVAFLNLFLTKQFVKNQIGKNNIWSIFKASIFGIPLPLCSCGVIPTAVYLSDSKASKSSVISFLISTPQTGVDSIIATYGMMGPVFAIFRPIAALFMGIFGGLLINTFKVESKDRKNAFTLNVLGSKDEVEKKPFTQRIKSTLRYSFIEFIDDIVLQFLVGLLIAGAISYFVPAEFLEGTGLKSGFGGMLLMIVIGAPMYICATASIPIAVSLMLKGFSPGVAFVFLAVGPATNAASFAILSKSLGKQIVIVYLLIVMILSIISGYVLDYLFAILDRNPLEFVSMHNHHNHGETSLIPYDLMLFLSAIFFIIILASIYRKYIIRLFPKKEIKADNVLNIKGMTCNHCVDTVSKAIAKFDDANDIKVDLNSGKAYFNGNANISKVIDEIEKAGYSIQEK